MGLFYTKKQVVKVGLNRKETKDINLDLYKNLKRTRLKLAKIFNFPFVFLDEEENEIEKERESIITINDILDGKNLHIKKEKKKRLILERKLYSKNDLDFYLFPKIELTDGQKEQSSNIMLIGETGVGKSTWIHSLINYFLNIEIDENIRYLLFDEEIKQKEYEQKYGKKSIGCSKTDEPEIYNIEPGILYNNPIRLIDTSGFGDTRGCKYDQKIIKDMQNLFKTSKLEKLNAVCLFFKASETRSHERFKNILEKVFSILGKELKKNIIIIFTFADSFDDLPIINTLKDKTSPFSRNLGNIDDFPYFAFNNKAFFSKDINSFGNSYQNNIDNFKNFFKYISNLRPISLESTKKVVNMRIKIEEEIFKLCKNINTIRLKINSTIIEKQNLSKNQNLLMNYDDGNYVLFCKSHDKICHKNCKYPNESLNQCNKFDNDKNRGRCKACNCNFSMHTFKMCIEDKNANCLKKDIENKIKIGNEKIIRAYSEIYYLFMNGIEIVDKLVLKVNKLNEMSLLKDNEEIKYEFIKRTIKENIIEKNKITDYFINILEDKQKIYKDKLTLKNTVYDYINSLLKN